MSLERVLIDIIGRDKASAAFDSAAASAGRAAKKMDGVIAKTAKAGASLTKHMTVPLLAIGAVSLEQASKFQKSMTLIQTAGGETAAKTAVISTGIKKLAESTGTSLGDLSEGIYTVAKAGAQKWSAVEQLKVLKAAAQGAKAENVPLSTSVNALTSVMLGYGASAKQAVSVENELIRGSGLAKTTMQEFAGSLANVVPLASALHISFAQVAGAIATMTQHGESAQRSTENLNNLIRSLAGQNNVATKAMASLGINSVNLAHNLGKRGLTGTLDVVEKAIEKNTKGGLVAVSAFKKTQNGVAGLSKELSLMPPHLASISKQFESGKLGYQDYYKDVKNLGGQAFVMGKQFIGTMQATTGFSDALKSGNPLVATAAKMLQQLLGGATGMNAALMLGGNSAKQFTSNVNQVAAAARHSGADVLGWAKTQDTFAVKMDKAKASLQVLAVEIGTKLIPVVTRIVSGVESAVHWFEGLSGTQKKVLAWSAAVLAAMGPILTIGARLAIVGRGIGAFTTGVSSMFTRLAGTSFTTSVKVNNAVRGMTSALAGAGIGLAFGSLARNSGKATKAVSVFGSAAAGAAVGFGIGGGPLGAAIGGITGALTAAVTAFHLFGGGAKSAVHPTDELTSAIRADNDVLGKNTQLLVASALQSKGLYDAGLKLGISQRLLTRAATGNKTAVAEVNAVLHAYSAQSNLFLAANGKLTAGQKAQLDAVVKLNGGLSGLHDELKVNTTAAKNIDAGLGKVGKTAAATQRQIYKRAVLNLTTKNANGQLELTKQGAQKVAAYLTQRHSFNVDTSGARSQVASLSSVLDSLARQMSRLGAPSGGATSTGSISYTGKGGGAYASGGSVRDGWFTVGEEGGPSGWELGHKSGSKVEMYSNRDARKMTGLNRLPGYATGTTKPKVNTTAIGTAIGTVGQQYTKPIDVSSVGIDRIMKQISHAQDVLNQQIHNGLKKSAAQAFQKQIDSLTREAKKQLAALKVKIAKPDVSAVKAALNGTVDDARTAFAALLSDARAAGLSKRDIRRIERDRTGEISKIRARDAVNAKLGTRPAAATAYDKLAAAQGNFAGEKDAGRSAVLSTFDVTTAGQIFNDQPATGRSILAALNKAVANARKFSQVLGKLKKDGLPPTLLSQFAHAGPVALAQAQALLSSGAGTIKGITSAYGALNKYAGATGDTSADAMYGAGVRSAKKLVAGLLSQRRAIDKAMQSIAKDLSRDLDKATGAHHARQQKVAHGRHRHSHSHSGGRGSEFAGIHIDKLEINEQRDPTATARAVARRLAHMGAA